MSNNEYELLQQSYNEALSEGEGINAIALIGGGVNDDISINNFANYYPIGNLVRSCSSDQIAVYEDLETGGYVCIGDANGAWAIRL